MSLSKRHWYNKLTFFYKIVNGLLPDYLHSCVDVFSQNNYPLRSVSSGKLKRITWRTKGFSKTFLPYGIDQRNKLNLEMRNAKSIFKFLKKINLTQKPENSLYNVHHHIRVKLLSRLRLRFNHLNKHKFRLGFNDMVNPVSMWCWCRDHWKFSLALLLLFYPDIWNLRSSLKTWSIFFKIKCQRKSYLFTVRFKK